MRLRRSCFASGSGLRLGIGIVALAVLAAPATAAANFIRVPQDSTLPSALLAVANGGVVEIGAGIYVAPPNSFVVRNPGRAFTVRAVAGAAVVLDGQGQRTILKLENNNRARGGRITFERLTFRNGAANAAAQGGAVTLVAAEAVFRSCNFEDNRADTGGTGGGAFKARDDSALTLLGGTVLRNTSKNRGGAIVVRDSTLTARNVWFVENRTNVPGHGTHAPGGAVYALDARVEIFDSLFERNEAANVGGALYVFGRWDRAESRADVTRSVFSANRVGPNSCCAIAGDTTGGAIHVEDHAVVRLHQSRLLNNRAHTGAGASAYRAAFEAHGSIFRGNRPEGGSGFGGAISALSNDFNDSATGGINRPAARVIVSGSFFEGGYPASEAPTEGGCLLAAGDSNRQYGENGVAAIGGVAENRAHVEVTSTLFADCDIDNGIGGAISAALSDVSVTDSLIVTSDARGPNGGGGGLSVSDQSLLRLDRTTFARNSAERWGGGVFAWGSTLDVRNSRFWSNTVSPGTGEPLSQSRGAALLTTPQLPGGRPARDVDGVVATSVFSQNAGLPVWDVDPTSGPINAVRYDGNAFHSTSFGDAVYFDSLGAPGGASVATLNALVVTRPGRPSTDKSVVANQNLQAAPVAGVLLAAPSLPAVAAGPGFPASGNLVGYAWSGSSASAAGVALPAHAGILPTAAAGVTLAVNGAAVATVNAADSRCTGGPFLCLNNGRFRAAVDWVSGAATGSGRAVQLTGDTGYFWFFAPANVELVTKVLDATSFSNFFWLFYGGLTDREFTLTVVDLVTGVTRQYRNRQGQLASAGDTTAFPQSAAAAPAPTADAGTAGVMAIPLPPTLTAPYASAGTCTPSAVRLCLAGGRIAVQLTWRPPSGAGGVGNAVPLTNDTGYFWFRSTSNLEVIVKVLDGRPVNGHFWVFYGALSNLEYRITVTDTVTGVSKTYLNPQGRFASLADTGAL